MISRHDEGQQTRDGKTGGPQPCLHEFGA